VKKIVILVALLLIDFSLHAQDFKSADAEMNQIYQQVLKKYNDNPQFIEKFKTSQRAWLKFRDAQLEAMYPSPDKQKAYGSAYPTCEADMLLELTGARTKQLRVWLDGIEEGDVCAGSVKRRESK